MVKTVLQRKPTAPVAQDDIERYAAGLAAKQQFIGAAADMGWRLALVVLIPVLIGVKLDDHFHSTPSYTLGALILAVGGAVVIIMNTIKQVNRDQQSSAKNSTASNKTKGKNK